MGGRWMALAVLTAARASLGFQFQSVASVSAPLMQELGLSYADLGLMVGLYLLPGVALALPGAALGRRFGDKRVVVTGLALMVAGGALAGLAEGHAMLVAGRLLSGVGAVLLNVLMAKMVTDWFAGREIILSMAIFVNSFPIGIGLALLALGPLAEVGAGWRLAMHASAAVAGIALLLVAFGYGRHENDGKGTDSGDVRISRRDIALVCLAGAMWGLFNGAIGIMLGFAPVFLVGSGYGVAQAGMMVGMTTWLTVVSVQAGGLIAQRWGRPGLLMAAGLLAWGGGMLVLPLAEPLPVFVAMGLLMGLPVGVIMSLPSTVLQPGNRALGMGIFYTWLYAGQAGLPPVAGWLQDLTGGLGTSLIFGGMLVLLILPVYAAFHQVKGAVRPVAAKRAA